MTLSVVQNVHCTALLCRFNEPAEKMRKPVIVDSFQVVFPFWMTALRRTWKPLIWTETETRSAIQWTAMFGLATDDVISSVLSRYVLSWPSIVLQLACHGTVNTYSPPLPPECSRNASGVEGSHLLTFPPLLLILHLAGTCLCLRTKIIQPSHGRNHIISCSQIKVTYSYVYIIFASLGLFDLLVQSEPTQHHLCHLKNCRVKGKGCLFA
jgi:hypothetical protein